MNIVLNRRGGVPLRDQLVTQLEMRILDGTLAHGVRLPSVRALARRLKVHHNTVSAAYQDLEAAGHVVLQKGSGVFVRHAGARALVEAGGLDEMIRFALDAAFEKGFSGSDIRKAVERWLAAVPPERVLVVDPAREMAELLAHELHEALAVPASAATPAELAADPGLASGALLIVLPYHVAAVRALSAGSAVEAVTVEVPEAERRVVVDLAPGSIVLFVSHAPTVLPFASVLMRTLRGDDIHVEARHLADTREWRRLVRAADLVVTDALSTEAVRRAAPRRHREVRMVAASALDRLRQALRIVSPRAEPRRPRSRGGPI